MITRRAVTLAAVAFHGSARYASTVASATPTGAMRPAHRIVSGIQPTAGSAHLGNYLGAIAQWVRIQNGEAATQTDALTHSAHDTALAHTTVASTVDATNRSLLNSPPPLFIFLADLHALTARPDAAQLRSSCLSVTATLLACGIDPARTALFRQSAPQLAGLHTCLAWSLGVCTPVAWLTRMTQYKDKVRSRGGGAKEATWGLLSYPALQAADILLYGATHVPVGRDQFQHVELCRDMAQLFNGHYASPAAHAAAAAAGLPAPFTFPLPLHVSTRSSRVMSLRSGTSKMSKSDPADESRLNLTDTPEQIAAKIKKAKTDSDVGIALAPQAATADGALPDSSGEGDDPAKPETANLVRLFAELSGRSVASVLADKDLCASKLRFKQALTDVAVQRISPIRTEFIRLQADEAYLRQVLADGEKRAAVTAEETMRQVRRTIGLD